MVPLLGLLELCSSALVPFDTIVLLLLWIIWRSRNHMVFDGLN